MCSLNNAHVDRTRFVFVNKNRCRYKKKIYICRIRDSLRDVLEDKT